MARPARGDGETTGVRERLPADERAAIARDARRALDRRVAITERPRTAAA